MTKAFRRKLEEGAVGMFSKTEDPAVIEAMGYGGADFVILDLEHGPNTIRSAQNLVRAAYLSGMFPLIRVKETAPFLIGEALDIGAGGIQVPQIESPEAARDVVRRAKFSPLGERGVCRFVRAAQYSHKDRFSYFQEANDAVIVLQIEGKAGIEALPEILEVKGIDVIFIGPYDLSQSLGVPGRIDHPLVEDKMRLILSLCREKGVFTGVFTDTPENARKWRSLGVSYIAHSVDLGVFHDAVEDLTEKIKSK